MTREELFELHDKLCSDARWIMEAKNIDYAGGSDDPFSNCRGSLNYGVEPEVGIMIRIGDKFKRIEALIKNGSLAVKDESAKDSIKDSINYSFYLQACLKIGAKS